MVSPTTATSATNSRVTTSASGGSATSGATNAKAAGRANGAANEPSSFAELLAQRDAAGSDGGAGAGSFFAGATGAAQFGALLAGGNGLRGAAMSAALHGAAGRTGASGAGSDEGALDGSAEARADGLDADEDPALATGEQGAHPSHPQLDDPLSPWARHCQQMVAPPALGTGEATATAATNAAAATAASEQTARSSLQELMPALVKKVAWSGDGTRGAVRLELGAGSLAGSTLLVHADGSRVRVQLDAPAGTDAAGWQREIRSRLEARGLTVDDVEVS
jgi:hypothetical protein